ncbi:MAG: FKBP-type peptidyl-prolyl cis-trans isomerase [Bacteroides sp.]|nr:FKBP-type peptidyl-prolyl cis-trans isomerase [Bacteroides sp.]
MTKFRSFFILCMIVAFGSVIATSCDDDNNNWDNYSEWREANEAYFDEQKFMMEDGANVYQSVTPAWNPSATILMRYLNDRSKTVGNLSPMLTSTVYVKYIGRLYNGLAFDSSYTQTASYGDSLFMTTPGEVIQGWTIALTNMRVGDSARVIIPYKLGYGVSGSGAIPPYSTLEFDIKLVDIPYYEVRP